MDIHPYSFIVQAKRSNSWYGYSGTIFARNRSTAIEILTKRYTDGVIRSPYMVDIEPSDEVMIRSCERIMVEEGSVIGG